MEFQEMRRGFFITLEGPEGSGKSSQAKALVATLRRAGHRVTFACDPGTTSLGTHVRRVLLHEKNALTPMAEALLFIAGRVQLVEEQIRPALKRGRIVICDRFHDSTVAYQGYGGGLNVAWLDQLDRRAINNLMPSLTILLDVPTDVGFARLHRRKASGPTGRKARRDRMEQKTLAFHRRVRNGYRALARREPRRMILLDATQSKAALQRAIAALVIRRVSR